MRKRLPHERAEDDVRSMAKQLKDVKLFEALSDDVLLELARVGFYEELEKGIIIFNQGQAGTNWFIIMRGCVDIFVLSANAVAIHACSLAAGAVFGEELTIVDDLPPAHCGTAVTQTDVQLLRIGQADFAGIWKRFAVQLEALVTPLKYAVATILRDRHHQACPVKSRLSQVIATNALGKRANSNRRSSKSVRAPTSNVVVARLPSAPAQARLADVTGLHTLYDYSDDSEPNLFGIQTLQEQRSEQRHFHSPYGNTPPDLIADLHKSTEFRKRTKAAQDSLAVPSQTMQTQITHRYRSRPSTASPMVNETGWWPSATQEESCDRALPDPTSDQAATNRPLYVQGFLQSVDGNVLDTSKHSNNVDAVLSAAASDADRVLHAGRTLRGVMMLRSAHMIRDRKFHLVVYKRCMVGAEMVDWLLEQANFAVRTRWLAVGIWQTLLEGGLIMHANEYSFLDKCLFYRWAEDDEVGATGDNFMLTYEQQRQAEIDFEACMMFLSQVGPDALFRMILQKLPHERTSQDLDIIYDELVHIKALSHLSTMVKRELARVLVLEQHQHAGTVLFNQGDDGKSWYIILKGSVDVIIHGKGTVCSLHEGDDFGKLALVNDAPRAATIVLREGPCQFLRVDKHDFNRILREVEANTLRLKEHGLDVLVLEKIPTKVQGQAQEPRYRYSVMAGTAEKMLEYLLETRMDSPKDELGADTFLEDFLLTHLVFMPSEALCNSTMWYYQQGSVPGALSPTVDVCGQLTIRPQPNEQVLSSKRRTVAFVRSWVTLAKHTFFYDPVNAAFIEELYYALVEDRKVHEQLRPETKQIERLLIERDVALKASSRPPNVVLDCGRFVASSSAPFMPFDTCVIKVYSADLECVTLQVRLDNRASDIKRIVTQKLDMENAEGVELVEVRSGKDELCIPTTMTLNGRLFVAFHDQFCSLNPLPEQDGPITSAHTHLLEAVSSQEFAYQLALFNWHLLSNIHEYEFIYQAIGRNNFGSSRITPNLDMLIRRFNELQYFVATEIVLCAHQAKRVNLLKKFLKIAAQSKTIQDFVSFYAIVLGLSNVAVSRLSQTWDKLPTKFRKMFIEFEALLDPSRNHRAYRMLMSKLTPPIIPFVPLLLKDLTFIQEGNKTYFDGLVNFEKMHMIAQILRSVRLCRSRPMQLDAPVLRSKFEAHVFRNFSVIDNQRKLTQLSCKLETKKASVQ